MRCQTVTVSVVVVMCVMWVVVVVSLSDHEIVLKYAKWALDKNQELAATVG